MSDAEEERVILHSIRLDLGKLPYFRLWRLSQGTADMGGRITKFGLIKGASDLLGILTVQTCFGKVGVFTAIEVKTLTGRLSAEQKMFLQIIEDMGGVSGVARCTEDARNIINDARAKYACQSLTA